MRENHYHDLHADLDDTLPRVLAVVIPQLSVTTAFYLTNKATSIFNAKEDK